MFCCLFILSLAYSCPTLYCAHTTVSCLLIFGWDVAVASLHTSLCFLPHSNGSGFSNRTTPEVFPPIEMVDHSLKDVVFFHFLLTLSWFLSLLLKKITSEVSFTAKQGKCDPNLFLHELFALVVHFNLNFLTSSLQVKNSALLPTF